MTTTNLRAIIVEDEQHNLENLLMLIENHCKEVRVVALCANAREGREKIMELNPDLVFLDIEMPGEDGFSMLEQLPRHNFEVIFVTAYSNYALKAIKFSALDYIVKPIDSMELMHAVYKAREKIGKKLENLRMLNLLENQYRSAQQQVIALPMAEKVEFLNIERIVRCEADGNYTLFILLGGEKLIISKTLKEYDELLTPLGFLRVHQSHLINLQEVKSFVKSDGGYILMKNGDQISISRQRRELVIKILYDHHFKR